MKPNSLELMGISLILFSSSSRSAAAPPIHLSHHQTYPTEPKPPGLDKHKITLVTDERPSPNDRKKHGTPSWVSIKLITTHPIHYYGCLVSLLPSSSEKKLVNGQNRLTFENCKVIRVQRCISPIVSGLSGRSKIYTLLCFTNAGS